MRELWVRFYCAALTGSIADGGQPMLSGYASRAVEIANMSLTEYKLRWPAGTDNPPSPDTGSDPEVA